MTAGAAPRRWLGGFELDPRAIALSRVGLGLVALADVWDRRKLVDAFYTDAGMFDRAAGRLVWRERFPHAPPAWSLHFLSGSGWFAWMLLALQGVAAALLIVGYRSRAAAAGAFVLLLSTCQRNAIVCCGGDWALVAFLMWAAFLPLDRALSVDPRAPRGGGPFARASTAAYVLQLFFILFFAGLQKVITSELWRTGGAVSFVLHREVGMTSLGRVAAALPEPVLVALDYGTLLVEVVVPWTLLAPLGARARTAAVAAIVGLFAGIGLTLRVGILPWVVVAAALSCLPSSTLDGIGLRSGDPVAPPPPLTPRPVVLLLTVGLVHAGLLNLAYLGKDYAGPSWLAAPCGFLVPQQGWRMFRDAGPGWITGWGVVEATLRGDREPSVRLPDGAPLDYGPASSYAALEGSEHWDSLGAYLAFLLAREPRIVDRFLDRACRQRPDLGVTGVALVGVLRKKDGFATERLRARDCTLAGPGT